MNANRFLIILLAIAFVVSACWPFASQPATVLVEVTRVVAITTTPIRPLSTPMPVAGEPALLEIIASSTTVFAAGPVQWLDFRVQFNRPPFDAETHRLAWCVDTDQNPATGDQCGTNVSLGADWGFTFGIGPDALMSNNYSLGGNEQGRNVCDYGAFDWNTNTLRILFPAGVIPDDNVFSYDVALTTVLSNESLYAFNFGSEGSFSVSQFVEHPLPFDAVPLCALRY